MSTRRNSELKPLKLLESLDRLEPLEPVEPLEPLVNAQLGVDAALLEIAQNDVEQPHLADDLRRMHARWEGAPLNEPRPLAMAGNAVNMFPPAPTARL